MTMRFCQGAAGPHPCPCGSSGRGSPPAGPGASHRQPPAEGRRGGRPSPRRQRDCLPPRRS